MGYNNDSSHCMLNFLKIKNYKNNSQNFFDLAVSTPSSNPTFNGFSVFFQTQAKVKQTTLTKILKK